MEDNEVIKDPSNPSQTLKNEAKTDGVEEELGENLEGISEEEKPTKNKEESYNQFKEKHSFFIRLWFGICGVIAVILIWSIAGGYRPLTNQEKPTNPSQYQELLNNKHVKEISVDTFLNESKTKASGLYFFGYDSCPWCNDALPVLVDMANEENINISYIYTKGLKNNKEKYTQMQDTLEPCLNKDDGKLYYPLVVSLKDGKVQSFYIGTVGNYSPDEREMTTKEKQELKSIYKEVAYGRFKQ